MSNEHAPIRSYGFLWDLFKRPARLPWLFVFMAPNRLKTPFLRLGGSPEGHFVQLMGSSPITLEHSVTFRA
jgi:hypothetical protein